MRPHCDPEELSALLDGELPPAATESVRGHLQGCFSCQATFRLLQVGADAIGAGEPPTVSPGFAARVKRGIPTPKASRTLIWPWVFVGVAASVALVAFFVGRSSEVPVARTYMGTRGVAAVLQSMDMFPGELGTESIPGFHTQAVFPGLEVRVALADSSNT